MGRLNPEKLHITCSPILKPDTLTLPRRYTLTHSDTTGDLYLTIASEYNRKQTSGWYARFMRDEVLAEWRADQKGPSLHVHCHVSGDLVFGRAGWREAIFRREMPMVLEAVLHGDRALFAAQPHLVQAPVFVHFHASQPRYNKTEEWGTLAKCNFDDAPRDV